MEGKNGVKDEGESGGGAHTDSLAEENTGSTDHRFDVLFFSVRCR